MQTGGMGFCINDFLQTVHGKGTASNKTEHITFKWAAAFALSVNTPVDSTT